MPQQNADSALLVRRLQALRSRSRLLPVMRRDGSPSWADFSQQSQPSAVRQSHHQFADYHASGTRSVITDNRGLCRTAREFLIGLARSILHLDTLTIAQVDDILARQVHRGGLRACALFGAHFSRLRAFLSIRGSVRVVSPRVGGGSRGPRLFRDETISDRSILDDVKRLLAAVQGDHRADIRARHADVTGGLRPSAPGRLSAYAWKTSIGSEKYSPSHAAKGNGRESTHLCRSVGRCCPPLSAKGTPEIGPAGGVLNVRAPFDR